MNALHDFIYANSQKQIIAFDIWLLSQTEPDGPVQTLTMSRAGRNYLAACEVWVMESEEPERSNSILTFSDCGLPKYVL